MALINMQHSTGLFLTGNDSILVSASNQLLLNSAVRAIASKFCEPLSISALSRAEKILIFLAIPISLLVGLGLLTYRLETRFKPCQTCGCCCRAKEAGDSSKGLEEAEVGELGSNEDEEVVKV